ncbi:MAG: NAD(P)-dependent oxidoreductase, partial [Clostridia bacterium]|nr:NAD(P)-dependent oxidoreductase [Clostridia bacterium]
MKITLMEPLGIPQTVLDGYRSKLEAAGHTFVSYASKTADPAEQAARVAGSDAVIIANTPFPAPVILGAPNLKFIDVAFTGIDHVGLDACRQKGVTLSNAAGYSTQCVAELALGLAVACLRFVPACDAAVRQGGTGAALRGTEICGKTVGIVGTGAIGLRTARLFLAFGARVIAHSRTRRQEALDMGIE